MGGGAHPCLSSRFRLEAEDRDPGVVSFRATTAQAVFMGPGQALRAFRDDRGGFGAGAFSSPFEGGGPAGRRGTLRCEAAAVIFPLPLRERVGRRSRVG